MGIKPKHIAVICNYELLENRVGGMDYFFWYFQEACDEKQIKLDWFFPNLASHGAYPKFNIIPSKENTIEDSVLKHLRANDVAYTYIITHFVELCTPFFAKLKKLQKAEIIAVDHNPRPLQGYPMKKRIKKRIKGLFFSKHIDQFIGVSEYTSGEILKDFGSHLKNKTQTVYNGVLIDDIIPKTDERRKTNPKFLVVSHLRHSKGIQDLIKAVDLLPETLKANLRIDVYGEGPYKETLLQLVKSHRLKGVFDFKGSSSVLKRIYKNYDYLVQPTHMECFSLSILESLAANVPVITTPVGGNTEVIKHNVNGFIFNAKNVNELSQLINELYLGYRSIVINTRKEIENKYSLPKMVEGYFKLIYTTI